MTQVFGHDKLKVYQKAMTFAVFQRPMLASLHHHVAACDHLQRGSESILINIAHSSNTWSPKERIVYLGHANGSALECAACLDILVAKNLLAAKDISKGKGILFEVVSMLIAMHKTTSNRICEEQSEYSTTKDRQFSHEYLDVYQVALQLVAWFESLLTDLSCSTDLKSKLDKSTTSIVLNIAEGNGRFGTSDQMKFYKIAYKATIQSAALVDLSFAYSNKDASVGLELMRRITAMLTALSKATNTLKPHS